MNFNSSIVGETRLNIYPYEFDFSQQKTVQFDSTLATLSKIPLPFILNTLYCSL